MVDYYWNSLDIDNTSYLDLLDSYLVGKLQEEIDEFYIHVCGVSKIYGEMCLIKQKKSLFGQSAYIHYLCHDDAIRQYPSALLCNASPP